MLTVKHKGSVNRAGCLLLSQTPAISSLEKFLYQSKTPFMSTKSKNKWIKNIQLYSLDSMHKNNLFYVIVNWISLFLTAAGLLRNKIKP